MEITSFALEIGTIGLPLYSWLSIEHAEYDIIGIGREVRIDQIASL